MTTIAHYIKTFTSAVIASIAKQSSVGINRPGLLRGARNDEDGAVA